MKKRTYFKAADGTIFIPEPPGDRVVFAESSDKAYIQCREHE